MKSCPICLKENPINSKFCYNCGFKFYEEEIRTDISQKICFKCRKGNPVSNKFCMFCGTLLRRELSESSKKIPPVNEDHPSSYWYCTKEKALMRETSPNHQFPLSKEIENSINKVIDEGKLKRDQRDLALKIAQKVFEIDSSMNYAILTRVRCPICMNDSLAPVYFRPKEEI